MSQRLIENFGELIRSARKERGLSQEALAYKVGLEQTDISKIELGRERPSPERAERIAAALGLDKSDFLVP